MVDAAGCAPMTPWSRHWLHLLVAVMATAGAISGLVEDSGTLRTVFWLVCLCSGFYNAVLFGVGWEQHRARQLSVN